MNNTMQYNPTPQDADEAIMDEILSSMVPDAFGNYIGPGWSDGKLQESVEWGTSDPQSELDLLAYYHDSAYAKFKDERHRMEADRIFTEKASKIEGGLAAISKVAVTHGNMVKRSAERTASNVSTGASLFGPIGALGGLIYTGIQNVVKANDMLPGGANETARKEVEAYYETDPHKRKDMKFEKSKIVNTPVKEKKTEPKPQPRETAEQTAALRERSKQSQVEMREEAKRMETIWQAAREKRSGKTSAAAKPVAPVEEFDTPVVKNNLEVIHNHHVSKTKEAAPPNDREVRVDDPRSLLSRLFKRKKKKKHIVVPVETEEQRAKRLIDAQRERFSHQNKLRENAENSALRTSEKVFVNKHGQSLAALDHGARVRRALSKKRLVQNSEVGGVKHTL